MTRFLWYLLNQFIQRSICFHFLFQPLSGLMCVGYTHLSGQVREVSDVYLKSKASVTSVQCFLNMSTREHDNKTFFLILIISSCFVQYQDGQTALMTLTGIRHQICNQTPLFLCAHIIRVITLVWGNKTGIKCNKTNKCYLIQYFYLNNHLQLQHFYTFFYGIVKTLFHPHKHSNLSPKNPIQPWSASQSEPCVLLAAQSINIQVIIIMKQNHLNNFGTFFKVWLQL